jgi:hypothetical protein
MTNNPKFGTRRTYTDNERFDTLVQIADTDMETACGGKSGKTCGKHKVPTSTTHYWIRRAVVAAGTLFNVELSDAMVETYGARFKDGAESWGSDACGKFLSRMLKELKDKNDLLLVEPRLYEKPVAMPTRGEKPQLSLPEPEPTYAVEAPPVHIVMDYKTTGALSNLADFVRTTAEMAVKLEGDVKQQEAAFEASMADLAAKEEAVEAARKQVNADMAALDTVTAAYKTVMNFLEMLAKDSQNALAQKQSEVKS